MDLKYQLPNNLNIEPLKGFNKFTIGWENQLRKEIKNSLRQIITYIKNTNQSLEIKDYFSRSESNISSIPEYLKPISIHDILELINKMNEMSLEFPLSQRIKECANDFISLITSTDIIFHPYLLVFLVNSIENVITKHEFHNKEKIDKQNLSGLPIDVMLYDFEDLFVRKLIEKMPVFSKDFENMGVEFIQTTGKIYPVVMAYKEYLEEQFAPLKNPHSISQNLLKERESLYRITLDDITSLNGEIYSISSQELTAEALELILRKLMILIFDTNLFILKNNDEYNQYLELLNQSIKNKDNSREQSPLDLLPLVLDILGKYSDELKMLIKPEKFHFSTRIIFEDLKYPLQSFMRKQSAPIQGYLP